MNGYLKKSILTFGIVAVIAFALSYSMFGTNAVYSFGNLNPGTYNYSTETYSIQVNIEDKASKSKLYSLIDTAEPVFSNLNSNYLITVCSFDDEDSTCKQNYDPNANNNVEFTDVSVFQTIGENGQTVLYVNNEKLSDEETKESFVRNVVSSVSDESLSSFVSAEEFINIYNATRDNFGNEYGAEHVADINQYIREAIVQCCISLDDLEDEYSDLYEYVYFTVLANEYTNVTLDQTVTSETDTSQQDIVGYWKFEHFPDVETSDSYEYTCFNADGTYEKFTNPGANFATHCQAKESGTYTVDGDELVMNDGSTDWEYTIEWTDTDHFDRTYVTHVDSYERVSEEEFMEYYS